MVSDLIRPEVFSVFQRHPLPASADVTPKWRRITLFLHGRSRNKHPFEPTLLGSQVPHPATGTKHYKAGLQDLTHIYTCLPNHNTDASVTVITSSEHDRDADKRPSLTSVRVIIRQERL